MADPCKKCKLPGGSKNFHVCVDLSYRHPKEAKIKRDVKPKVVRQMDDPVGDFMGFKPYRGFNPQRGG